MALCFYWTILCSILLMDVSTTPSSPQYVLHQTPVSFEKASRLCSPGVLTTLSTKMEAASVLDLIAGSIPVQDQFTFWVGLKLARNECVVPALPLRGFKWTADGSQESQLLPWTEEPQRTCTSTRCAALQGQTNQSTVTAWGLIPISCKHPHPFICKLTNGNTGTPRPAETTEPDRTPPEPKPGTPEPQPTQPQPELEEPEPGVGPTPENPESKASEPETFDTKPVDHGPEKPEPDLRVPELEQTKLTELGPGPEPSPGPNPGLESGPSPGPTSELEPGPEPSSDPAFGHEFGLEPGPEPDPGLASGLSPGPGPCAKPVVPGERSVSLDPDDRVRIRVECWSSVQLDLFCGGDPIQWRMGDGSVADLAEVCRPCSVGFRKDEVGQCQDVDECSAAPCRSSCVNTVGSFKCGCVDVDGHFHDDGEAACEGVAGSILMPVVIAVVAVVVLVAIVLVTVKCCLIRRSKMKNTKEEERGGGDSFQTANEKAGP